jgi:hypothetical protein
MAGKRGTNKRRPDSRQKTHETTITTTTALASPMTDIDTQHSSQQLLSRRHSSDEGTQSEPATSESTHTAMTSVVGTDDSFDSSILEEDSEMTDQATEEDDVHEYQSVYFGNQSHYRFPGGTSTYRTEMHEANGEDG